MKTLKEFYYFVDELKQERGRNYKISVLEKYKNDPVVKQYLYFLYNPFITTGISAKKLSTDIDQDTLHSMLSNISSMSSLLNYLSSHNTGRRVDISVVQKFRLEYTTLELVSDIDYREFVELFNRVVTKNLPLGIDTKTINSVIPGFIPSFNVMLANKYFDKPQVVDGKLFAITTKIDGGRILAVKKNGSVKLFTRQGQLYEGLVDLEEELAKNFPDNICLDGEITLLDKGNLSSKEQYKETMKITRKDGEKHGVKMLVFDCISIAEFEAQNCTRDYWSRHITVTQIFNSIKKPVYFELLPILYIGTDTKQINKLLEDQVSKGEEGIMINIADAPYEFKRTNNLLKVKKMQDLDLEVIGFEEGTNRNAGKLGALLVDYNGNVVKVGSGFSDTLRVEIWENQEDWLGRTIVVQYFEETTNQDGGSSLRFPVYIDYRTDK